jgi:PIN domain nuclease of toxin-antitoxin system
LTGYLLDTNVALLGVLEPQRLSAGMRRAVETGPAYLRVVSYLEVTIKTMRGDLDAVNFQEWWPVTLESLGLRPMLFRAEHVAAIQRLDPHHADLFDRAIIATAIAEELVLLTTDKGMELYAGQGLAFIR